MKRCILIWMLAGGAALVTAGCGDNGMLRTQGRILKGGEAFIPEEGQWLRIQFVPISEDRSKPPERIYVAEVDNETGTFRPWGPMKEGMPAGRYRVAIELMNKKKKDLFEGKYDTGSSPFIFDVDEDTEEIVIDLDRPPLYSPVAAR